MVSPAVGRAAWLLLLVVPVLAGCDQKFPAPVRLSDSTLTAGEATDGHSLLALGDSFSSGEGAPVPGRDDGFLPGTDVEGNRCHRSSEAYGYELQRRLGDDWSLTFRACSGAKLENLGVDLGTGEPNRTQPGEPFQTDLGDRRYDVITMTMGGNDLNFAPILKDCVANGWADRAYRIAGNPLLVNRLKKNLCQQKHEKTVDATLPGLEPKFVRAFQALKKLTKPGGQVIVLGYPLFFPDHPPSQCGSGAATMFGASDMLWLNSVARRADAVIERAAITAEVSYVDEHNLFRTGRVDHGVCQDDTRGDTARWVNRFIAGGARLPDRNWSFHPTVAAHKAEAGHLLTCIRDRSTCDPARKAYPSLEQVLPFPDKFDYPQVGDFGEDPRRRYDGMANGTTTVTSQPGGCLLLDPYVIDPGTGRTQQAYAVYPFIVDRDGNGTLGSGELRVSLYQVARGRGEPLRAAITGWPDRCLVRYHTPGRPDRYMRTKDLALEPSGEAYQGVSYGYDFPYANFWGYYSVGYSNGYVLEMTWGLQKAGFPRPEARVLAAVNDSAAVVRREIDGYLPTTFDQRG